MNQIYFHTSHEHQGPILSLSPRILQVLSSKSWHFPALNFHNSTYILLTCWFSMMCCRLRSGTLLQAKHTTTTIFRSCFTNSNTTQYIPFKYFAVCRTQLQDTQIFAVILMRKKPRETTYTKHSPCPFTLLSCCLKQIQLSHISPAHWHQPPLVNLRQTWDTS